MKRFVVSSALLSALSLSTVPAHAQEQGQIGLVMALPTDVGLIWHVSENIAVRPEINFSFGSSETETSGNGSQESSVRGYSLEGSVLFYLASTDTVRTYVSPRIGFEWASVDDDDSDDDLSTDGIEVSASFGAQYTPVRRFSIFGEIGLEYFRASSEIDGLPGTVESTATGWGPRSMVGIVLYLGGN